MFDLNAYLDDHRKRINHALESLLKTSEKADRILEAMTYSLMAGGKRIRPVLCLAATEAAGGDLPLETAIKKFEEGMKLTKLFSQKLDETEKKSLYFIEERRGPEC